MTSGLQEGEELPAGKAYDVDAPRSELAKHGIGACIPPKSNRLNPATYDKETYKRRRHVENFIQWAKRCRRIGTRHG